MTLDRARSNAARGRTASAAAHRAAPVEADPLWYKDAVIYEVHVRAFSDSNGDGIGDFRGLTQKLDYLQDLGVTAIWLLPFYPSPLRDDGYDIADYTERQPDVRHAARRQARSSARRTGAGCGSSPSWSSTTRRTSIRGSSGRGARQAGQRRSATSTSGATRPTSTRTRGSSSRTSRRRTGPGIRSPRPTTGTASTRTSPT